MPTNPGPADIGYWDFQFREALAGLLRFGTPTAITLIRDALANHGVASDASLDRRSKEVAQ